MDLKKALKTMDSAIWIYLYVFIFLMAGIGFLTGVFSLGYLITTITGEWPPILTLILNGFNVALWVGFGLMVVKWLFFVVYLVKKKRGNN